MIEIIEEKDGWGRTRNGWVSEEYLSRKKSADPEEDDIENVLLKLQDRNSSAGQNFDAKLKYFSGETETAPYSHQSDSLFVTITEHRYDGGFYYLTHLIVKDPESQMHAALSYDSLGGARERTTHLAKRKNAVVATNGSCFSYDTRRPLDGSLIADGEIYRSESSYGREIALTKDGRLFTPPYGAYAEDLLDMGVTDSWSTSRSVLIEDGILYSVPSEEAYPRCAYGMVEPGEYYIITAGTSNYSGGLTLKALQEIFADLGCSYTRPLDEGGSATLVFEGELINTPAADNGAERPVVDFVYFTD